MAIPIWVHVVILIASAALSYAMRPRMQGPQPAAFEDIQFPQFEEGTPQSVVFGDVWCNDWMVLGVGNYRTSEVRKKVGSGIFRKRQTIGFRYHFGIHMGVARAFDELVEIRVGDRTAWSGSAASGSIEINEPNLFGGDEEEGGIVGTLQILTGASEQLVNAALATMLGGLVPAFRGTATLFYDGQVSAMSPYPKPWKMRVRRTLSGWEGATWNPSRAQISLADGTIQAANAAHMIYECITNRAWGRGLGAQWIDAPSFEAAADTLHDEGFGLCLRWARQDGLDQFIQALLDHVGGVLRTDRVTGLLSLQLIREDYDPGEVPVFTFDTGLLGVDDDETAAQGADTNEVIVVYRRPQDGSEGRVRVNHLASIQASGGAKSTRTIQYPGIPTAELALRVAQRDLLIYSGALRRFRVRLDRRGRWIQTGDVFRISVPSRGIENMVLRAGRVDAGTPTNGVITIDAIEDQFGLPQTAWIQHQASEWTPPNRTPVAIDVARTFELPYTLLADMLPTAELAALPETAGLLGILARRPTDMSLDYMITTRVGESGPFVERNEGGFSSTGLLSAAVPMTQAPVVITLDAPVDLQGVAVGDAALIDEEILRVDAVDVGTAEVTLARGCADTVPTEHDAGARVWFLGAVGVDEETRYDDEDVVQTKLLTRTSAGELESSVAPIEPVSMDERQFRPYPPGRLQINGSAYPTAISGTELLSIAWAHRDRELQAAQMVSTLEPSIGPEDQVHYNLRIYGEEDEIVVEELELDDTSFVFDAEAGGGGGPSWTPGDITTQLWLDAADESTLTVVDGAVSEWRDKSGNDRHFAQGTADRRPLRISDGVYFDNSDASTTTMNGTHHMSRSGVLLRGYPFTVIIVVDSVGHTGANSGAPIASNTGNTNYAHPQIRIDQARTLHRNTTNRFAAADADFSGGARKIVHCRWRADQRLVQVNDEDPVVEAGGSSSDLGTSGTTWLGLERSASFTWPASSYRGAIREILLLDFELDDEPVLWANILAYLNYKWMSAAAGLRGRYRIELSSARDDLQSRQLHDVEVRRHGLGYNLGMFLGGGG